MQKKPYQKPEIKEVKLTIEDTLLGACRSRSNSKTNSRSSGNQCRACLSTYRAS